MRKPQKKKLKIGKASRTLVIDFLKSTITALGGILVKIVWNIYGVTIIAVLSFGLLGLQKWLHIRIILPIYFLLILGASAIFLTAALQIIIKRVRRRTRIIMFEQLKWEIKDNEKILGPFCPKCRKLELITTASLEEQFENAASAIFGDAPFYSFSCSCGYRIEKQKSRTELLDELRFSINEDDEEELKVEIEV